MKMKNSKIKLLSFMLALLMLVSTLFNGIAVNASTGSGVSFISPANSRRYASYSGSTGSKGIASNIYGFRIKAFEVSEFSGGDYSYFSVSNGGQGDKVSLTSNILNAQGYSDVSSWLYFTPMNKSRTYSFYLSGQEFTAKTIGTDSEQMAQIKDILGMSDSTYFASWDSAFQSYSSFGEGYEADDRLAQFLGVTPGSYYFFVVEGLMAMFDPNAQVFGDDYSEKFIFTSYQNYCYDGEAKNYMSCHTTIDGTADRMLSDPLTYINQGSIAPFGLGWAAGQPVNTGFCVYGDINGSNSSPTSLNIVLQYQGSPNTTDGAFVSATSLIKQEASQYNYWSVSENAWKSSTGFDEVLQTNRGVVTESPYAIAFEDYYWIENNMVNTTASKLIESGNASNQGYSMVWGNSQVLTGDEHVGYSIRPTALDGKVSTIGIMEKFISVLNNGMTYGGRVANDSFSALSILEACIDNVNRAYSKTDIDAFGQIRATEEAKLRVNKKLGTAIEFIVKGQDVTSHKVTINVDSDGNVGASETWNDTYSSVNSTTATINSGAVCYVVVPNSSRNDGAVTSALSGVVTTDAGSVLNITKSALSNVKLAQVGSGISIGLGCEPNLEGYTIYEIIVANKDIVGSAELPAYMLNRYYANIIQTSSNGLVRYQVNKDSTVIREDYSGSVQCSHCESVISPVTKPSVSDDYRVEWLDTSNGTPHVNYDNALKGYYFIDMEQGVWSHANRSELTDGVSEDTKTWSNPSGLVMDYGFNLIRASAGDYRSVSGISYPSYDVIDSQNILRMAEYFGTVPSVVKEVADKRNPLAVAGVVSDTLSLASRFTRYSGNGFSEGTGSHKEAEVGYWTDPIPADEANGIVGIPSYYVVDKEAVDITYYTFTDKTALGFRKNTSPVNTMTYSFESTIYKYETDILPTGKNSVISNTGTAISVSANKAGSGVVSDANEYRFANVRNNNVTLNFYPEVKMVANIAGTTWQSVVESGYQTVYTMGEKMRAAESSSLYLFKINGTGENAVTGVTYSDTMSGGSSALGTNKVVVPAGADVNVVAKPEGVSIDLYGYALDIIDKDIDATFNISANTIREYNSVVASGADIYEQWMGTSNIGILKEHFISWSSDILNVDNFGADFGLYVNGEMKSDSFSATIGNIQKSNEILSDGVYQLEVENGELIKNTDYQCMIKQIAADYGCSEAEAVALFEASGIYTSILNAIESSTSSFNASGVCDINADWTSALGNDTNWYDESVKTFVVRRFTNLGNKITDVIASDKIDYSLAPNGSYNNYQGANAGNTYNAEWKLNVFFNSAKSEVVNELLLGSGVYYNASSIGNQLTSAEDSYTLILNQVPVSNADFEISASSTNDFGY